MKFSRIVALCVSLCLLISVFTVFPSVKAEAMNAQIVTVGSYPAPVLSDASTFSGQVATASSNNTFLLLDTRSDINGTEWYKIRYSSSIDGWINSVYAEAGSASSTADDPYTLYLQRIVRVNDNEFMLRAKPGSTQPEVARVSKNDRMVVLNHGADSAGVTWYEVRYGSVQGWIRRTAVEMTNFCSAPAPVNCAGGDVPVIFLSPSRQPSNPYAAGNTNECEQMTRVAVALQRILEANYNCRVILSDYETPISKSGRPLKAFLQGADIYIAIHSNAGGSAGTGYGPQGYYFPGSAQGRLMAENLVESLAAVTPFSNSSKRVVNGMEYLGGVGYGEARDPGGFGMISILLEVEFHDHADSAVWIINNTEVIAKAIADGLHKTFSFRPASQSQNPGPSTTPTLSTLPLITEVITWHTTTATQPTTIVTESTTSTTQPTTTSTTTTSTTTEPTTTTTEPTTTTTTATITEPTSATTTTPTTIVTVPTTTAPTQPAGEVVRAGGSNRIETAIEISKLGWDSADTVIIASGSSYPDALAGVPLSAAADAPILLSTDKNGAESALLAEIQRLGADKAYILGGTAAVSAGTESDLTAAGLKCVRLAGDDRYMTGIAVAKELAALTGKPFDTIYFASAQNFPDALAVSPVAAMCGDPILYISPDKGLSSAVAEYVSSTGCGSAVLLGGTSAVSEESARSITALGLSLERISGSDRYATAVAVAERFADRFTGSGAALATGKAFPDALAGGAHAAKLGVPVLLTGPQAGSSLLEYAASRPAGAVYVYGGTAAVSAETAQTVCDAVNG